MSEKKQTAKLNTPKAFKKKFFMNACFQAGTDNFPSNYESLLLLFRFR